MKKRRKKDKGIFRVNKRTLDVMLGVSIFLAVSVVYDWWVGDRNIRRYIILISTGILILGMVFLRIINKKKVRKIFSSQMGVD